MTKTRDKPLLSRIFVHLLPPRAKAFLSRLFQLCCSAPTRNRVREAMLAFWSTLPKFAMLEKGEVAIEVGTPNPDAVRELSAVAGPGGRVVVVEPEPRNVATLREAQQSLRWDNVEIVEAAAFSADTTVTLSLAEYSDYDHKVAVDGVEMDNDYRPENRYEETVEVKAYTLDTLAEQLDLSTVDYLEVDVNGAEYEVLKGATGLLEASPNARVLARGHMLMEDGCPLNRPIRSLLESLGLRAILTYDGERAVGENPGWERRAGNVFAYKRRFDPV